MKKKSIQADRNSRILPADISMIADDLAGACDTGFEFLGVADQVTVVVDVDAFGGGIDPLEGLAVYNTESRALPADIAYAKARRAAAIAGKDGQRILMKKTDSAFRGRFGPEIAAVMDELDIPLCCLAPAIPDFGRVTRKGIQYLDGRPISASFYSKDPKHPVTESRVAAHAAVGNDRLIGVLDLDSLRQDSRAEKIEKLIAAGIQIVVTDSENRNDLQTAAALFLERPGRILFVGGQGIGNALAGACVPSENQADWTPIPDGPVLVVCGTLHPRSREQATRLARTHHMEPVLIRIDGPSSTHAPAEATATALMVQMNHSGLGLLSTPEDDVQDPGRLEQAIAAAVQAVCKRTRLAGLLLTGGTTGYEACIRIGIQRLRLRQKIAWGAIMAQAPELDGMAVLVKGGSLGDPEAMNHFVETVRSLASHK